LPAVANEQNNGFRVKWEADFLRAVEKKRALTDRPRRSMHQRVKRTNKEAGFTWVKACLFSKPDFFGPFAPMGQQEWEYRIIFGEPHLCIFGHLHEDNHS
jgi:hypothetical protein